MKKLVIMLFAITTIAVTVACSLIKSESLEGTALSQGEPAPVTNSETLPYTGIWVSDIADQTMTKQVLVFTDTSIYHVRTGNWANVKSEVEKEGGVHEDYYEIVSTDLEASTMVVKLKWVRTDGRFGGFDMPTKTFKYSIDGDAIRFSFGPEGEYPTSAESDPYYKQ